MKACKLGSVPFRSKSAKAVYMAEHTDLTNRAISKRCGIKEQTVCAAIARVTGSRIPRK